jgi:hypothetical protein
MQCCTKKKSRKRYKAAAITETHRWRHRRGTDCSAPTHCRRCWRWCCCRWTRRARATRRCRPPCTRTRTRSARTMPRPRCTPGTGNSARAPSRSSRTRKRTKIACAARVIGLRWLARRRMHRTFGVRDGL